MQPFSYRRASSIADAIDAATGAGAAYFAGGTTLLDLMKLDVLRPNALVDINALPLAAIELGVDDVLHLGALARMSDVADDATVRRVAPALAEALDASASAQLRNMATLGGNLLQRTRCFYFRDTASACHKREPGSGCDALRGDNEEHAVLGTSESCIAVHASDFSVALAAFDATLRVQKGERVRTIPAGAFWVEPGATPWRETTLEPGELVLGIDIACRAATARSTYVKVRERASYAFALASCAAGIELAPDGTVADVRIALGGVGTIPWRALPSEAALRGQRPTPALLMTAAKAAFTDARPTRQNAYKIDLGTRTIVRALEAVLA